uniref:Uncharacterized protein n=1 Tax=Salix viminalis TaxID=40686 RepID=A0A6N2KQG0_SALVM
MEDMKFGLRIVASIVIVFFGATCGRRWEADFVPMLTLIITAEEKPLPGGATSHDQIKPKSIKEELYGFSSLSSPTSSLQQLQSSLLSLSLAGEKQKTQRWKGEEEKNGETERVET